MITGLVNRVVIANEKARRGILLKIFTGIIKDTPVDIGRARGNWQTEIAAPKITEIQRLDKTGNQSVAEAKTKTMQSKFGDTVYFTNNVPYIIKLENGHSKQAINGMFRRNIIRIVGIVQSQGRSV